MAEKIGFIGLGIMGRGMAANLLAKGFDVAVWNRTARRADGLVEAGAARAESPAAVAQGCPIVITCVSDTPDVEAVVLGPGGVIEGVSSDSLVIDCSTISPQATLEIAKALEAKGASMLDAPISGGSEGAEKGTLSIMVGGRAEDFERARPCLEAMGTTITHVGTQGAGQTVKLVNQILVVGNCVAMCEALLFAQAGGVDLQKTFDAISQGAAGSWMFTNRAPQIIQRDWSPGFMVSLQQKDLRLVLAAADEMGVPIPVTAQIFNLYRTLEARGLHEEGNHALIKALEHLSGIEVGAET
ncbi:MAG: NAD(P)-dependent oxidoreductase [Caldilineaceae bacterium SB0662_bin_9]|uniref:NAD(P)-dependent oxidoreductase n=1 Tax=Caldilineaceae bacterium SB0662_bin_9 TaxID=2605258 RepID=A0A6B1DYV3_9CHLR|nr:NAD(P)-dependent oxidoreductase [Caldilineaceae bacterium SB0662_bin_9]